MIPWVERKSVSIASRDFAAKVCYSQGFWSMSGDGSVGDNFVANAAIVSLCSLVSIMEKQQERKS
jgi:hypothetical protein